MFEQRRAYWRNLDNAAKMFSAASSPKDTRVFRFYCLLKEPVDSGILQEALNKTIKKYPVFLSVMRKGLFWHYLEKSELRRRCGKNIRNRAAVCMFGIKRRSFLRLLIIKTE